ncbi:MAG: Lipolytic protein family [Paenibacillus sp.]|nr:Lipolytic protein family [Paenibacillus sp.]
MRSVFVIGDSISIHYGPYLQTMLAGRYDRKRGDDRASADLDRPAGANGGDSSRVLSYMRGERERGVAYDILLLNCGLHDIKTNPGGETRQIPLESYKENLQSIAALARKMANEAVWVRTTDVADEIHNTPDRSFCRFHADVVRYNEAADHLFRAAHIPLLDLYGFSRMFGNAAFCDHVHYTEDVRKQQAAFIVGFLEGKFAVLRG